jgi:hypothetical protein
MGSIGEYTVVASAKRGVRGTFSDDDDELEEVRPLVKGSGRFFSSLAGEDSQLTIPHFGKSLILTEHSDIRKLKSIEIYKSIAGPFSKSGST